MELGWLIQTRPDIACAVGILEQATTDIFDEEGQNCARKLNKVISTVSGSQNRGLRQIKLDLHPIHLRVYSDGSLENNCDLPSELGFIIFASDCNDQASPIVYRSYKSRLVVSSIIGA